MSENPSFDPSPGNPPEKPTKGKPWKHGDFWLGLVGMIGLNVACVVAYVVMLFRVVAVGFRDDEWGLVWWLPWVLNGGAFILALILKRPRMLLGMILSLALVFVLVLIAGIFIAVTCFFPFLVAS